MHRRELLELLGAAALTPALAPLSAEQRFSLGRTLHLRLGAPLRVLTPAQDALVTTIAELIIPETDTPGATSVKVDEFIDLLLAEWYGDEEKMQFLDGLTAIDAEAMQSGQRPFASLPATGQAALLTGWEGATGDQPPLSAAAGYKRIKALTVYGYFTSERVTKEVTKPIIFHPAFEGCVPYVPGGAR
jgi:hypothetical protein